MVRMHTTAKPDFVLPDSLKQQAILNSPEEMRDWLSALVDVLPRGGRRSVLDAIGVDDRDFYRWRTESTVAPPWRGIDALCRYFGVPVPQISYYRYKSKDQPPGFAACVVPLRDTLAEHIELSVRMLGRQVWRGAAFERNVRVMLHRYRAGLPATVACQLERVSPTRSTDLADQLLDNLAQLIWQPGNPAERLWAYISNLDGAPTDQHRADVIALLGEDQDVHGAIRFCAQWHGYGIRELAVFAAGEAADDDQNR